MVVGDSYSRMRALGMTDCLMGRRAGGRKFGGGSHLTLVVEGLLLLSSILPSA